MVLLLVGSQTEIVIKNHDYYNSFDIMFICYLRHKFIKKKKTNKLVVLSKLLVNRQIHYPFQSIEYNPHCQIVYHR